MNRKLVSVQKIVSTEPIEGADRIEIARVQGWQCVTQKSNNFKPGDLVAYFEIDSLIPLSVPQFAFLKKKEETEARIKTIKLKGKFAQGLILPLSVIDEALAHLNITREFEYEEDLDLTELLGVKKWEVETAASLAGNALGLFPSFVSKTDETRIQNAPRILQRHHDKVVAICEKLDGSSTTVFYVPRNTPGLPAKYQEQEGEMIFGVASRNLCLEEDDGAFWRTVKGLRLREKMQEIGKPMVFQGELIGPGVQKNRLKLNELTIKWFNAVNPIGRTYYSHYESRQLFDQYGISPVPFVDNAYLGSLSVDQWVTMSMGKSLLNPAVNREGIVVRPMVEEQEIDLGGRFSFKVINPEYLVEHGE